MKRTFPSFVIIGFVSFIIFFACSKSDSNNSNVHIEVLSAYPPGSAQQASIAQLQNAARYSAIQSFVDSFGTIDINNTTVIYYNDDTTKPWFAIPVYNHDQLIGTIRVIKVGSSKIQALGRDYVASFVYYSGGYSESSPSGNIKIYDLDDSNLLIGSYVFTNGTPTGDLLYDQSRTHYCDKNQNGNVTFAECMTCMIGACFSNTECAAQCLC